MSDDVLNFPKCTACADSHWPGVIETRDQTGRINGFTDCSACDGLGVVQINGNKLTADQKVAYLNHRAALIKKSWDILSERYTKRYGN